MIRSIVRYGRRFPRTKQFGLLFLLCGLILFNIYKFADKNTVEGYLPVKRRRSVVENKKDLLNVDVRKALQRQSWKNSGFNENIRTQNFIKKKALGYVSNLDINKLEKFKKNKNKKEENDNTNSFTHNYPGAVDCHDLEYSNTLEYLIGQDYLDVDYVQMRRHLLNMDNHMASEYKLNDEKDMSESEIIEKRWYAFGTAAVWLETENCYVAYTRMIYSKFENRARSYISSVVAQAYDENWKEIKNKRIQFRDVTIPNEVKKQIKRLQDRLNKDNCKGTAEALEDCYAHANKNHLKAQKQIDLLLDKYSVKYPTVLNVPFKMREKWNGPEDPHVILKKDDEGEEPVIIFNMASHKDRKLHAFMPHRKVDPMVMLNIEDSEMRQDEKNWSPFFYPGRTESSNASPGFINFVYDYNPLEVVRCSLFTGICNSIFDAGTLSLEKGRSGAIRGGTQYVPLPDILPEVKGKKMWIGFPKTHVENCGCGSRFYRPVLSLLVESDGIYHLELIAPNIDFGKAVLGWNLKDTDCGNYNVLSPSSISNWIIVNQDQKTKQFEDYMTLTFSEADAVSGQVTIRGVLNYVLQIYNQKEIKDTFTIDIDASAIVRKTSKCVDDGCRDECKRYGLEHPEPKKEEDKKKNN
ncbi:beta-mannosyltransferase 4 [Monosporozyma unispora]|nr:hypothetical protein C6P44_005328 [Kazachstania unispora]